jgi:hypothetical protein
MASTIAAMLVQTGMLMEKAVVTQAVSATKISSASNTYKKKPASAQTGGFFIPLFGSQFCTHGSFGFNELLLQRQDADKL